MRGGGLITGVVLGGCMIAVCGGCVSMEKYDRLRADHRTVIAEKEQLNQDLFDERSMADVLRNRLQSFERELAGKDELMANLRGENQLLEDMRHLMQGELENLAGSTPLSTIHISGPRLPEALDSALRQFAQEHPTAVVYDPTYGTVKWKSDLLFALGSDVVKQSSMAALQGFTDIIKSSAADDFEVLVVGHTDSRPISRPQTKAKHPTNWHLSAHRAIAVSSILRKNGYVPQRIGVMGYGEYRPIADNSGETGASQNRRVEIYMVPAGSIVSSTVADAGIASTGVKVASTDPTK